MRIKVTKCFSCICNSCTKFYCPYPHLRCKICSTLNLRRIYDCDFFENVHTAPKRYRIKLKRKSGTDMLNTKLDYIIASLGLVEPVIDILGTYAVLFKGTEIFRGSYADAESYITKMQHEFSQKLVCKKIDINL